MKKRTSTVAKMRCKHHRRETANPLYSLSAALCIRCMALVARSWADLLLACVASVHVRQPSPALQYSMPVHARRKIGHAAATYPVHGKGPWKCHTIALEGNVVSDGSRVTPWRLTPSPRA
eukprot:scaffold1762_cov383-Prasinococcus_capsulatus_cf.AAC.16